MLSSYSIQSLMTENTQILKEKMRPYRFITIFLIFLSFLSIPEVFNITDFLPNSIKYISYIVLGETLLSALLLYFIAMFTLQYRILFQNVIPKIVQVISVQTGRSIKSIVYPKIDRDLNKVAGLFNRYASVHHTFLIEDNGSDNGSFKLYQTKFIVSTGNSSHTIFKGLVYAIPMENRQHYQIRTKQKPTLKGINYSNLMKNESFTLFVESNHDITLKMQHMLKYAENLYLETKAKDLFISATLDTLYIAIKPKESKDRLYSNQEANISSFSDYLHQIIIQGYSIFNNISAFQEES